jgi:hypothetical protein
VDALVLDAVVAPCCPVLVLVLVLVVLDAELPLPDAPPPDVVDVEATLESSGFVLQAMDAVPVKRAPVAIHSMN